MTSGTREVWITGVGLLSSLGAGAQAHWKKLGETLGGETPPHPMIDETSFAPYPVHPLPETDFSAQIPKRSDLRQMEGWQKIGVFAAGLALDDAGLKDAPEILHRTHVAAAAGNGERDPAADRAILEAATAQAGAPVALNESMLRELRPTLYLAQQSQLLAGNISIVLGARGACRTYKGEEVAGAQAVQDAARRIASGELDIALAGGACNAQRWDQLLIYELGARLWRGVYRPLWDRARDGGGMIPGSMGAFLLLEARSHAEARGAAPHARIAAIDIATAARDDDSAGRRLLGFVRGNGCGSEQLPVMSGATGFEGPQRLTSRERARFAALEADGIAPVMRAHGGVLGHGLEAHFPAGLALAALAVRHGEFYPPFDAGGFERPMSGNIDRVLVTGHGNVSGEAAALVTAVEG